MFPHDVIVHCTPLGVLVKTLTPVNYFGFVWLFNNRNLHALTKRPKQHQLSIYSQIKGVLNRNFRPFSFKLKKLDFLK